MSDIVLKWVGWKKGYEGLSGWPAKDLTQAELDTRGLSKAELLAYRPRLYVEVAPEQVALDEIATLYAEGAIEEARDREAGLEAEEVKPVRKRRKRVKKAAVAPEDRVIEPAQEQD